MSKLNWMWQRSKWRDEVNRLEDLLSRTDDPANADELAAALSSATPAGEWLTDDQIKHEPLFMRGYDAGMKDARHSYEAHYDSPAASPVPADAGAQEWKCQGCGVSKWKCDCTPVAKIVNRPGFDLHTLQWMVDAKDVPDGTLLFASPPPQSAPQDAQPDEVQCLRCGFVNYVQDGESPAKTQHRMQMKRTEHLRLGAAPQAPQSAPGEAVQAWITEEGDRVVTEKTMAGARADGGAMLSSLRSYKVPLYTHPATTNSAPVAVMKLTDEQIYKLCGVEGRDSMMKHMAVYCARAIEAALREKDGGKA